MKRTRLAIVDAHPLFRVGFGLMIGRDPSLELVGDGCTVRDALRIAAQDRPDQLFLDIAIGSDGAGVIRRVLEPHPELKVVVLTASESEDDLLSAMSAGVHGYLLKAIEGPELLHAIQSVRRGDRYVTPYFAAKMLRRIGGKSEARPQERPLIETLSARETEVLRAAATGSTNREIGLRLDLSEKTIKHYMTIILQKLNARNRVEATILYRQSVEPSGARGPRSSAASRRDDGDPRHPSEARP